MNEVVIRRDDKFWSAFDGEHRVMKSKCKRCIINAIRNITRNSHKYTSILVMLDEGAVRYPTGVGTVEGIM